MKKLYCLICGKHRKFKNLKISYIFKKALVFSINCSKYGDKNEKILKISIERLKILCLVESI